MDREACHAAVHGVPKSQTSLGAMRVWRRAIGKASFHPREVSWVIFLSLILRIDWLFLLFLKIEASRHNGDNK